MGDLMDDIRRVVVGNYYKMTLSRPHSVVKILEIRKGHPGYELRCEEYTYGDDGRIFPSEFSIWGDSCPLHVLKEMTPFETSAFKKRIVRAPQRRALCRVVDD